MNAQRLRIYRASLEMLGWLLRQGDIHRCVEGVPAGAIYRYAYIDEERRQLCLVFEHETFSVIDEGTVIPSAWIVIEKLVANPFKLVLDKQ